ncbi:L-serine ammonia-lyase, iron-sulfur-dependent, subunit alpha [Desulfobacterales bacterium HSG16]|nr:L-serine ammonia-lyase, iron-sulfur-dependent, subunit alpha [Desulfobacterales bacterium HSG16]
MKKTSKPSTNGLDLDTFFTNEVKPSVGCTETGAVAFAASTASLHIEGEVNRIHLRLSANIYKNGMNVGVPGTSGIRGNLMAAALGAVAGNPSKGLQALSDIKAEDIEKAQSLLSQNKITQEVAFDVPNVYVEAELSSKNENVTAIISQRHDLLVEIRKNGRIISENHEQETSFLKQPAYIRNLLEQDMKSLWDMAEKIDDKLADFLLAGVDMNRKTAEMGLESPWGLGIGYALKKNGNSDDLLWKTKMYAAAAADVRMGGGPLSIMSSAGSGNHGITAILPAAVVAEAWKKSDRKLAEAVALSHLLTGYIKAHTGLLSPICGCAMAAGMGAAVSIVKLGNGTCDQGRVAAASLLGSVMGMICDGAKGSCALKVSTASGEAFTSAVVALSDHGADNRQGILTLSLKDMADTIATLSKIGMSSVDSTILKILEERDQQNF